MCPIEVSSRAIYENGVIVGVQGMARDITERKLAQDALQMFSRQLIEAQEDERRRIARELHDQIGQILTAVKMNLHTVQQFCQGSEAGPTLKTISKLLMKLCVWCAIFQLICARRSSTISA